MTYPAPGTSPQSGSALTTAIFSPSFARIAATTARDWSYVDTWLASKLPGNDPPPLFERNKDTLNALLTLCAYNEATDGERQLVSRADAMAYRELQTWLPPGPALRAEILATVQDEMTDEGINALTSLAKLAIQAADAFADPRGLGLSILGLYGSILDTEQMTARAQCLGRNTQEVAGESAELIRALEDPCCRPRQEMAKNNLDLHRRIKAMLVTQQPEHGGRPAAPANLPQPTARCVAYEEHELLALLARKGELEKQVAAFCMLPSEADIVRDELDMLCQQLQSLTSRRDAAFEGLVERASPTKRT